MKLKKDDIFDLDQSKFAEKCKGHSSTVQGDSLQIEDLARRALIGMPVPHYPEGLSPLDQKEDETHDDSFEGGMDFVDVYENQQKIDYLSKKIEAHKKEVERMKKEQAAKNPVAETSVNEVEVTEA